MQVIRAAEMGMCFGVRDALELADGVEAPSQVSIYGELVHNQEVVSDHVRRGFHVMSEREREILPSRPRVLITAHGVSERERRRLEASGKELVDTTCPLVRFVHRTAAELAGEGRFVVVIGKPGHAEVRGLIGDLEHYAIVEGPHDVIRWDHPRIGVVFQTTAQPDHASAVVTAIRERNPGSDIRVVDTICGPTRNRQDAARALCRQVDAVVVVGGHQSNNTRQLVRLAELEGRPAMQVASAAELDPDWLRTFRVVGLTAGTSTLERTVEEVHEALRAL